MERLTYKLKKPTQNGFEYVGINGANAQKVLKKLGELEDLEEQGLLLKLPCKVGTEVWTIMCGMTGKHPTLFKQNFRLEMVEYWGKAVFLTKAEAEKALEEMEK